MVYWGFKTPILIHTRPTFNQCSVLPSRKCIARSATTSTRALKSPLLMNGGGAPLSLSIGYAPPSAGLFKTNIQQGVKTATKASSAAPAYHN